MLLLVGAASVAVAFRGIFVGGVHWDAGIDTTAAIQLREITPDMTLQQAYDSVDYTSEWYGVFVQASADWLHQRVTGSTEWLMPHDPEAYLWQGVVNVIVATLGAGALAWGVGRVLRSALAGAFAWALLWTTPLWAGMAHLNAKDIPVAAGLTMTSVSLMLVMQRRRTRWDLVGAFMLGPVGAMLAVGQRVGTWTILVALLGLAFILVVLRSIRRRDMRSVSLIGVLILTSVAVGLASLWLMNPIARIDLPQWLYDSFVMARAYQIDLHTRTAGVDVWSLDVPSWYVPAWLGAQLPVLTSAAVLLGAGVYAKSAFKPVSVDRDTLFASLPLVIQGVLTPTVIVLMHATLYSGLRHILFIVPALIGIAAFVIPPTETWLRNASARVVAAIGVVLALLVPVLAGLGRVTQWFPYSYAFVNPVASRNYPERDWDLDAWGVSAMEGVQRLQEMGESAIAVYPSDFSSKIFGGRTLDAVQAESPRQFGFYQFVAGDRKPLPPGCEQVFAIERAGMVLGEGAICRR